MAPRQICDNFVAGPRQVPSRLSGVNIAAIALQWLIRMLAVAQLMLGVPFWTGNAFAFIPLHMLTGQLLVVAG
jgi:hypothetical protein